MDLLTGHLAVAAAVAAFAEDHAADLPEALRSRFTGVAATLSPVDLAVNTAELLFANVAAIEDAPAKAAAMTLAGQCAAFCAVPCRNFHGFASPGEDGAPSRGDGILAAMSRELGEPAPDGGWPAPESDPAPRAEWLIP